jgi:beta-N-acetylhexosaminidase
VSRPTRGRERLRLSRDPAARRRLAALIGAAAVALAIGIVVGAGAGGGDGADGAGATRTSGRADAAGERGETAGRGAVDRLTLRQQVGQLIISSFDEAELPDYMRRRLRARETAGVILFARNGGDVAHWRTLTGSIQEAAGRQALVMVDQEGGDIRTLAFAGPAAGQASQGGPAEVRTAARDAARQLDAAGVNVNLAPVADVSDRGGRPSVMDGRAFTGDADAVAAATRASVQGMREGRIAATAKHFPGLGGSMVNTDDGPATVPDDIDSDLAPFEAAIDEGVPLVMLSHALYPALDADEIASQSDTIATGMLREELGFEGVAVTDSMEAQAVLARSGVAEAGEHSIRAGADLLLLTGSGSWNEVFPRILEKAQASPAFKERVRESAARVLAVKSELLR